MGPKRPLYAHLEPLIFEDDFGDQYEFPDYPAIAKDYCLKIISGAWPACLYVRQACQRYLKMLKLAETGEYGFYFSEAHACDFLAFTEELPLAQDNFRGVKKTELEPWQILCGCVLYGFRDTLYGFRWVLEFYMEVPRKQAKDLALDTPIPTPSGWTTMGEIEVGDEVFAADGSVTRVLATSEIFPSNKCYRVNFSNGESVVAGEGHQWLTTARVDKVGAGVGQGIEKSKKGVSLTRRVRTTQELFETQRYGARGDVNHSIEMPRAVELPEAELPLDPYLVGAWLGDGTARRAEITCGDEDVEEISNALSLCGVIVYAKREKSGWRLILRPIGSLGIERARLPTVRYKLEEMGLVRNKHIPASYLRASREQRIALLQGLMDTDGTIDKDGRRISFCTTKPAIRDGVCELLASLGVKFACIEKESFVGRRKVKNNHWQIAFVAFSDEIPAFRLSRKLARMRKRADLKMKPRCRTVQIVSVEEVETVPTKCIMVEHPDHLFLFGKTMLPTHNSVLATAIGLYDVRDEQYTAPTILIAASTLDQANRVYGPIHSIINLASDAHLRNAYGLKATKEMVTCATTAGTIEKVASIGERQDGWNPTTIILEELHAQNPDVYAVLKSAIGSRGGQLLFQITTAGRDTFGLAWDNRKACISILEGHDVNWRYFGIIYTLDKEDLEDAQGNKAFDRALNEEHLWVKACPNLGVSFDIGAFRLLALSAKQKPQEREEFYRTRVNIWTNAASKLFNIEDFRRGARPGLTLEDLRGKPAWIGLDASTADDLSSICALVEYDEDTIAFINKFYAASDAPIFTDPDYAGMCMDWRNRGLISCQREGRVNHNEIEEDLRLWYDLLDVVIIGADPAMAGQLMQNLEDDRIPVIKYLNKAYMMSAPVDDLMARAHATSNVQLIYDANPVTEWCFANVHGEKKKDGTILMFKDTETSLNKIDGAVAAAMANGLRMNPEFADKVRRKPSVYEKRGLLGAST